MHRHSVMERMETVRHPGHTGRVVEPVERRDQQAHTAFGQMGVGRDVREGNTGEHLWHYPFSPLAACLLSALGGIAPDGQLFLHMHERASKAVDVIPVLCLF